MKRASWLRKAVWTTTIALLLLGTAGVVALRVYLSSAAATRQVAEQLQDMLGGRVTVRDAQIGLIGNSNVSGIEAYEEGEENKPWLRIDNVEADVSALSVLRSQSPQDIHLHGARVVLRFDRAGHLLTEMPSGKKGGAPTTLPRLHLVNGELTFNQQSRAPMIIRGLNATVVSGDKGALKLSGTVADPYWGDWKADGDFDSASGKGGITLDSDKIVVTMPKLKSIALIPLSTWDEIHVEGTTPAKLRLDIGSRDGKPNVRYRVEIAPRDARIKVPSIDLEATQANGKAIIADEIVEVDNVSGKTAGGTITAGGKLNFHDEPSRLDLKVGVQDVVLHDLPPRWNVPRQIDGKLTGSADVVVTLKQSGIETAGSGEGVIRDAKLTGFPVAKPIRLALRSNGRGFQFHRPESAAAPATNVIPERRVVVPAKDAVVARREPKPAARARADDDNFFQNVPAEMVDLLGRGLQMTADGLAKGIDAVANALGKFKPPSNPGEEPTYLDVDLSLQNVDLAQLIAKLKLNLPYAVLGRLTFKVHVGIPVNTVGDLKAYRLNGTASLTTFNMAGLAMTNVEAKVRYTNGVLDLENLSGQMPSPSSRPVGGEGAGKFDGNARIEVVPRGDLQASLKLKWIPVATILSLIPQAKGAATGTLSGEVKAHAPLEKVGDPANWRGSAKLETPGLVAYGIPLTKAAASLIVDETHARLDTFAAEIAGLALTGKAELRLQGVYPFSAEVHTGRADLSALNRLGPAFRPPVELAGRAELNGKVSGTLTPLQFETSGDMKANDLVAEGFTLESLSFGWLKDKTGLKFTDIKADLYGGSVSGSAVVPLDAAEAGTANLHVHDLDVKALAKSLPSFPVPVEGKVSGTMAGKLATAQGGQSRTWNAEMNLTAPQLRVQGIPAEHLKANLESHGGKATYNLQGETLGGTFTLKGDLPMTAKKKKKEEKKSDRPLGQGGPDLLPVVALAQQPRAENVAGQGRFELHNALLSRVWAAYRITGELARLNGRFSIVLDYQLAEQTFTPSGHGTFRIVNIRWNDETLANNLQGEARLTADDMRLYNVVGDVAGGQCLASFGFGLEVRRASHFQIALQQMEATRLSILMPAMAGHISGPVDLNLQGRIGREWDGGGGVTLAHGQVYGMDVTEWRLPFTFRFSPAQSSGEVNVRDSHARLAQGRARFESTMNWGNGLRLTGLLLFYQVDLRTLLRNSPEVSAYASGRVSGRVDLAGSEMRSINDLSAVVQAKMTQGQALQLPVLRQIIPYLRPRAQSSTFQSGELKGRLAGGIFRIQRASLVGDFLKLLIQGTINLAGNLNLDVTAQSGLYGLNPSRTDSVRSRIPLVGAIPRLVIYEASSLLASAIVHLRVTGTTRSPVIHLEPLLVMTEESIRFFLNRAVGLDLPNLP
jgi:translocation and assembly module TamB